MKSVMFYIAVIAIAISTATASDNSPLNVFFDKGLTFVPKDSSFSIAMRFRMQNRIGVETVSDDDLSIKDYEMRTRRLRLRFDGFLLDKNLNYNIQLNFSRADQDWDDSGIPNVIRDAYISYKFTPDFNLGIGQRKLPGNRQRVVSSGDQQFVDRSIVNANFNIDRDFGLYANYSPTLFGDVLLNLSGAVSTGDGRSNNKTDDIAYTGRAEILPFGKFTGGGDYYEADLAIEQSPKLSIGGGMHSNNNAIKTRGELGKALYDERDLRGHFADLLFKYQGFSLYAEYMDRTTPDSAITRNSANAVSYVYAGHGINVQAGYLLGNNYEIAARFSRSSPDEQIWAYEKEFTHYTIGFSKYLSKHRIKMQSDLTYETRMDKIKNVYSGNNYQLRFQFEFGI